MKVLNQTQKLATIKTKSRHREQDTLLRRKAVFALAAELGKSLERNPTAAHPEWVSRRKKGREQSHLSRADPSVARFISLCSFSAIGFPKGGAV